MDIPIIFEGKDFLVINKPSGIVVNRAETAKEKTIQDWVEERLILENRCRDNQPAVKEFLSRSGIVHRLDKETSGLLVIAKNPAAFEKLKSEFQNRITVKKYLTLVHGEVVPHEGEVNVPIDRNPFNRRHFGVFPGGREARTTYHTLANFRFKGDKGRCFTYLEVCPTTGRTHQIRVHMKYLNYPIVSDAIYGGRKNYREDIKWCPRLFLHATYLKINNQEFFCPLPEDLKTALSCLQ